MINACQTLTRFLISERPGHVDAGKSTLMGHLLYQLGSVNKKVMHKYEQESRKLGKSSFAYAWVLDETEEERLVWLYPEKFICKNPGRNNSLIYS